jgi:iron complex transport system permease protein
MKSSLVLRPAFLPLALLIKWRVALVLLGLSGLILAALVINAGVGEYAISPGDVIATILGNGVGQQKFIVLDLRIPRSLVALLVGAGLAVSGTILQGLTRNALASPEIMGVTAGASLGAVSLIIFFAAAPIAWLPFAALVGAAISAAITYRLAWRNGVSPLRLILTGIAIAAVTTAGVNVLLVQGEIIRVNQALIWLAGSVYGRSWEHLWPALPWFGIFVPLTIGLSRQLNVLNFGDDIARGLGSRVELSRGILLFASVALAGVSVALAGAVGFVGLMAPHIARRLVGGGHGGLVPTAALVGGLLVVTADLVGRTIVAPVEIPCGLITAAIGAPFFIWLLVSSQKL